MVQVTMVNYRIVELLSVSSGKKPLGEVVKRGRVDEKREEKVAKEKENE